MNRHLEKHYIKLSISGKILWNIAAIAISAVIALAIGCILLIYLK